MATTIKAGFYGTDTDTYYVAESGRIWNIQSEDDLGTQDPVEVSRVPGDAIQVTLNPDDVDEQLGRIESAYGVKLLED